MRYWHLSCHEVAVLFGDVHRISTCACYRGRMHMHATNNISLACPPPAGGAILICCEFQSQIT